MLRWLVLATFIVILNETIMVNAIPRLMVEFDVTARDAQWLSTAFMLTMATVIPVTGWFLQRVTTRTAFTVAMATFMTGTLVSALAPVFWLLVSGRVVQAAGTAVMVPLLMTTLMTVVPEHDRGRVMGNVTLAISVAPALGPTISGIVLQWTSWRWLFGLVLPVAAVITVLALRRLKNVGETKPGAIDWLSVVLAGLGFGGLVYGLSGLGEGAASAVPPVALVAAGLVLIGLFALRQRSLQKRDAPLLDLRTLAHRTFTLSLSLQAVSFLAMLGAMILLPLYLQDVRGLSPLQTGLMVAPGGIAMGLLGPSVGCAFDRFGGRPLVVPGSVGIVAALVVMSRVGETTPYAVIVGAHLLLMVSLAATFTPAFTLGLGALPAHLYSHGSSLLGTAQQVAAAVGTAVAITVLSSRAADLATEGASPDAAFVGGMQTAFTAAAGIALLAVVFAVLLPSRVPTQPGVDAAAEPVAAPA
ncbi:multidrug efflux MFS transporter [Nocardioides sp. HDW12B]|nr:multidrug efflux MFS transporter [Nocardioides sp. HDW12B]